MAMAPLTNAFTPPTAFRLFAVKPSTANVAVGLWHFTGGNLELT
jgi:hypothetical protein